MVGIPGIGRRKSEAFVDLAEGALGTFGWVEETDDPRWINVAYYLPGMYGRAKMYYRIPKDALIHVPPGMTKRMYQHGLYYLLAGEGGNAPVLKKLGLDYASLIKSKNEEIQRLKGIATSQHIYARRALGSMKTALQDHADIQKTLRETDRKPSEGGPPWIRGNRFKEED